MSAVAELHQDALRLFEAETQQLASLMAEAGSPPIRFPATITTQSGRAVAMLAPIDHDAEKVVLDGAFVGVLWLTPGSVQSRAEHKLRAGVYALRLLRRGKRGATLEFVRANGRVVHTAAGAPKLAALDLWEKIKKFLKDLGVEVDVKIEFGGGKNQPSKVKASLVFWDFDLFDDP